LFTSQKLVMEFCRDPLQVAIFNPLAHYINITIKNVVKVCSSESVNPELLFDGWV
jgi:hypothetical protein